MNNNLLAMCKNKMKDYRVHHNDINFDDTGAIVAIIIYFIAKEPSICRTKLECYILLLDRICVYKKYGHLFSWQLNNKGRINSFNVFIEFMLANGLIHSKENSKYHFEFAHDTASNILEKFSLLLSNITYWLDSIVNVCKDKSSRDMLSQIIGTKTTTSETRALKNVKEAMDRNLRYHREQCCMLSIRKPKNPQIVQEILDVIDNRNW